MGLGSDFFGNHFSSYFTGLFCGILSRASAWQTKNLKPTTPPQKKDQRRDINSNWSTIGKKTILWIWPRLKNINELLLSITQECPAVICHQETFLKYDFNIKIYQLSNYIYDSGCWVSGGTSVLMRKDISYSKVITKTNIQVAAIKATLHIAVNICSMYIPPSDDIDENAGI